MRSEITRSSVWPVIVSITLPNVIMFMSLYRYAVSGGANGLTAQTAAHC
jgi:hypothetical protein